MSEQERLLSDRKLRWNRKLFFYFLLALMPLGTIIFLLFLNGYGYHVSLLFPAWNDEFVGWWPEIKAIIEFGKPLGYYGYNETHSQIGTFGPWGFLPHLPYAVIGKIIRWYPHTMAIANCFFLGLALFVFCLITHATERETVKLGILYLCSFITVGYSFTSMAEGSRYAIGIVLMGAVVWLQRNGVGMQKTGFRYSVQCFLIIFFLLYAVSVYTIFALLVPVICWYGLRGMKLLPRLLLSILLTIIVAVAGVMLNKLICAPYVESTIETILFTIRNEGIYHGGCFFLNNLMENLQTISFEGIINQPSAWKQWFFIEYTGLLFCIFFKLVRRLRSMKTKEYRWTDKLHAMTDELLPAFILTGFLLGYCALYTGGAATLCRGINTGFLMVLCYAVICPGNEQESVYVGSINSFVIACTVLGFSCIWSFHNQIIDERVKASTYYSLIKEEASLLNQVIDISPEKSEWENTIAYYGEENVLYLAMPTGAGLNYMIDGKPCEQSGYAVFENVCSEVERERWTEQLQNNGYSMILKDNYFTVFTRNPYSSESDCL